LRNSLLLSTFFKKSLQKLLTSVNLYATMPFVNKKTRGIIFMKSICKHNALFIIINIAIIGGVDMRCAEL